MSPINPEYCLRVATGCGTHNSPWPDDQPACNRIRFRSVLEPSVRSLPLDEHWVEDQRVPGLLDDDWRVQRRPLIVERGRAARDLAFLAAGIIVIVLIILAASRSAQTTSASDVSWLRSAEQSEAPLSPPGSLDQAAGPPSSAPALVGGASPSPSPAAVPEPSPAAPVQQLDDGAVFGGIATWCAPTPTQCRRWGGHALLGAVPSFRWGDPTYRVRVCRQDRPSTCVTVTVVSFCQCPGPRAIDLSPAAFRQLAPLSRGVVPVSVENVR